VNSEHSEHIDVFGQLLNAWDGDGDIDLGALITDDYVGHMLHLKSGERTALMYPAWIAKFREANPGTTFEVLEQHSAGTSLWSRLVATRGDGATSRGMNHSRFVDGRIAEEWALWSEWFRD